MTTQNVTTVRRRVILGTSLLALALASFYLMRGGESGGTQPEQAAAADVAKVVEVSIPERPDCRYSLVAGGVYTRDEVKKVTARDAVVAAHYRPVSIESLREERAVGRRRVFVSYRIRDKVYWSPERVTLDPGEIMLTDGRSEIRARCGNLISETAYLSADAAGSLPTANSAELEVETGSSADAAAADVDPIAPEESVAIVLPTPDPVLTPPGLGGIVPPSRTAAPWLFVGGGSGGGSDAGSPGSSGTDGSGGGGVAGSGVGGGDTGSGGSGGGIGSGGSNGGGSGGGGGDQDRSGEGGGDGAPGLGGSDGPGSGGGGSSTPNSNPEGPGNGNPGGPGNGNPGGPGNGNPGGPGNGNPGGPDGPALVTDKPAGDTSQTPVRVPEPTTLSLLAIGLGGAALSGRRRTK